MEVTMYQGEFMWPPRPESAVPREMLPPLEGQGWAAQFKKNGTCGLIAGATGRKLIAYDRHSNVMKSWQPGKGLQSAIYSKMPPGHFALVGEVLHSKVPGIRDTLYVFDVVAVGGQVLIGVTFKERMGILKAFFPGGTQEYSHADHGGGLWVARTFGQGFSKMFQEAEKKPEDEGIVLKMLDAKLGGMRTSGKNDSWQLKCRWPHKNYGF